MMIKKLFSIPFPILTPIWILSAPIASNISSYIFSHPTSPRKSLSYPLKMQNLSLVFVSSFPIFKNLPVLDCDNMVYMCKQLSFYHPHRIGFTKDGTNLRMVEEYFYWETVKNVGKLCSENSQTCLISFCCGLSCMWGHSFLWLLRQST